LALLSTHYDRCGRKSETDEEEEFKIVLMAIEDPSLSFRDISDELEISYSITRRSLRKNGLFSRIAAKKTKLNAERKANRIRYCQSMLDFPSWNRTVFVDESHFCTSKLGPKRVIRPRGTRFQDEFVNFVDFSGRVTCSVFGMLTSHGLGPLILIDGRMNALQYCDILESCLSHLRLRFPHDDYFFVQDNCPIHTARVTTEWTHLNMGGEFLDHPPYSPELNPIENIWGLMKQELRYFPKPNSREELFEQLKLIWSQISMDFLLIENLYSSIVNRLQLCLRNNGSQIPY